MTHNLSGNLMEQDGDIHTATLPYELLLRDHNKPSIILDGNTVARLTWFPIDNYRFFQPPYRSRVNLPVPVLSDCTGCRIPGMGDLIPRADTHWQLGSNKLLSQSLYGRHVLYKIFRSIYKSNGLLFIFVSSTKTFPFCLLHFYVKESCGQRN